jgi:hypothetical protein
MTNNEHKQYQQYFANVQQRPDEEMGDYLHRIRSRGYDFKDLDNTAYFTSQFAKRSANVDVSTGLNTGGVGYSLDESTLTGPIELQKWDMVREGVREMEEYEKKGGKSGKNDGKNDGKKVEGSNLYRDVLDSQYFGIKAEVLRRAIPDVDVAESPFEVATREALGEYEKKENKFNLRNFDLNNANSPHNDHNMSSTFPRNPSQINNFNNFIDNDADSSQSSTRSRFSGKFKPMSTGKKPPVPKW